MGTLTIPGVNGTFQVDDAFQHLPADQQQQVVQQMLAHAHAYAQGQQAPDSPPANAATAAAPSTPGTMKINIDGIPSPVTVDDAFGSFAPEQQQSVLASILQQYHGNVQGQPAPDGSLGTAAGQSIMHGLPAAIASGVAGVDRYLDDKLSGVLPADPQGLRAKNNDATDAYAASQRLAMAKNYQRPDDVAPSVAAGFVEGKGLGDKLLQAGKAALYGTAESAGPVAAGIVGAPLAAGAAIAGGPVAAAVGGLGLATDGLMALSGVRDAKQREGLDPNSVTTADIASAGAQTALNALPTGSGALLRTALGITKGAAAPILNDANAIGQGGDIAPGQGLGGSLAQIGNDALEGATQGGLLAAGHSIPGLASAASTAALRAVTDPSKAGPDLAALTSYQKSLPDWEQAVAAEKAKLQAVPASVPGAAPDPQGAPKATPADAPGFQETAEANAIQNGAVKPDMSSEAQQAAARLALLQMFQTRKAAEPARGDDGKADANTFKGIADDLKTGLGNLADGFLKNGLIDKDTHGSFMDAIAEAGKHNRNLAEDGEANGYMPTALDKVHGTGLDPNLKATFVGGLRVLDQAANNGLVINSKGPLEKNAGVILGAVGALPGSIGGMFTAGHLGEAAGFGLGALTDLAGGIGSQVVKAQATSLFRQWDRTMGWNKPPALDGADAFMRLAQARGLNPAVTPQDITDAQAQMATLRGVQPGATQPAPVPGNIGPPVSTAPRMPQPAPAASQPAPPGPGMPQPASAAPQASQPAAPITAPPAGAIDPLHASALLARAQQAQAAQQQAEQLSQLKALTPTDRRGWSASMASTLGVQHDPMMAAIRSVLTPVPGLPSVIEQDTIPRDLMTHLTNHLADLRDAGALPLVNAPSQPSSGAGIRNPIAYKGAVDQEAAAGNALRPRYAMAVATIQGQKTVKAREAALETLSAAIRDPIARARMRADLKPLTQFGSKADPEDTLGRTPSTAAANDNH